jgi:ATP adenylyltransferase
VLEPNTLWTKVSESTAHALQRGALWPLPTHYEFLEQQGIRFLVRILANLIRKDEAKQKQVQQSTSGTQPNPFLPYDKDLFVTEVSDTHICLLNKFNVIEHHLLIVTRAFAEQESALNLADFEALWTCMQEFESLGFYNAGQVAGASQRHKHLQVIPLPVAAQAPRIPIEPVLQAAEYGAISGMAALPFLHRLSRLDLSTTQSSATAQILLEHYQTMLNAMALDSVPATAHPGAYNLLVTRQWMLLVPRVRECFQGISINALGFAGAFLVRNRQQLQLLKAHGPLTALTGVTLPTID